MILPVQIEQLPQSADQLRLGLEQGLARIGIAPRTVVADAPAWPQVASLEIDFSEARLDLPLKLPGATGAPVGPSLKIDHVAVKGQPVTIGGLSADLALKASAARFGWTQTTEGLRALALENAEHGEIMLQVQRADLEKLAQTLLSQAARAHGADIVDTRLSFTSRGPRSLSVVAEVTAKVMIMKAQLTVTGDLDLADDLTLRIANLQLTGSGMAANLARGFLQPHFERLQKQPIALGAFAPGQIRLRDLTLSVEGERLRLLALFGSA